MVTHGQTNVFCLFIDKRKVWCRVTSPDNIELIVYESVLGLSQFYVREGLYRNEPVAVKLYPYTKLTADQRKEIDVLKYNKLTYLL